VGFLVGFIGFKWTLKKKTGGFFWVRFFYNNPGGYRYTCGS